MFQYIKENHKIGLSLFGLLLVLLIATYQEDILVNIGPMIFTVPWLLWIRSRMKNPNIKHYQSKIKSPESGQENELSTALEWGVARGFEQTTVHKMTLEKLHAVQVNKDLSPLELAEVNQVLGKELEQATDLTDIPKMLEHYVMFGGVVISYPIIYYVCMITAPDMTEFTPLLLLPWAFVFLVITDRAFRVMEKKGKLQNTHKLKLTVIEKKDCGEMVEGRWESDWRRTGEVKMKEFLVSEPVYKNKSIDYIKKTAFYSALVGSLYYMLMVYLFL